MTKDQLSDARLALGKNKTQMAQYLGLNRSQYTKLENGTDPITETMAARIQLALRNKNEHSGTFQKINDQHQLTTFTKGRAGRHVGYDYKAELRKIFEVFIGNLPPAHYSMFEVEGASMERNFSHGDLLLCERASIDKMRNNRVYVLIIDDPDMYEVRPSGIWIKRCTHREENGKITCKSDNKDSTEPYVTFQIPTHRVRELWYPTWKFSPNLMDPNRDIYDRLDELEGRIEMLESLNE